jgi:hypothetical protein
MEYEVCIFAENPPQYMKFYKTLEDYNKCNISRITVIGNWDNPKDREQYHRLKEIHEDVEVEFIDENKDRERAEELLEMCRNAKHLFIITGGWLK